MIYISCDVIQGEIQQLLIAEDPLLAEDYCLKYIPDCDSPLPYNTQIMDSPEVRIHRTHTDSHAHTHWQRHTHKLADTHWHRRTHTYWQTRKDPGTLTHTHWQCQQYSTNTLIPRGRVPNENTQAHDERLRETHTHTHTHTHTDKFLHTHTHTQKHTLIFLPLTDLSNPK